MEGVDPQFVQTIMVDMAGQFRQSSVGLARRHAALREGEKRSSSTILVLVEIFFEMPQFVSAHTF